MQNANTENKEQWINDFISKIVKEMELIQTKHKGIEYIEGLPKGYMIQMELMKNISMDLFLLIEMIRKTRSEEQLESN